MLGKGQIQPDHIPVNRFDLLVLGLPVELHFTALSGIEAAIDAVELPDKTRASGGEVKPTEFTASLPLHHDAEFAAMEAWFAECHDRVTPDYKKAATLVMYPLSKDNPRTFALEGVWISARRLPDLDATNEGEMAVAEYTLQVDAITPIS